MTDCTGKKLEVGDGVVYIQKTYCTACLARGTVSSIKKMFGKDIAIVNGYRVTSQSIYKLESRKND